MVEDQADERTPFPEGEETATLHGHGGDEGADLRTRLHGMWADGEANSGDAAGVDGADEVSDDEGFMEMMNAGTTYYRLLTTG